MATRRALGLMALLVGAAGPLLTAPFALAAEAPKPPARTEPRRLPDYDGRSARPAPGEGWLWVPRVVLFPLWVVSEYVVRRPLGWATTQAERANLHNLLLDFFTFGPDRAAGVVPTALLDFGFRPSVGLYAFWDDAGAPGHDLRLYGATGGAGWWKLTLAERFAFGPRTRLEQQLSVLTRPDFLYAGPGWDAEAGDSARYASTRYEASLALERQLSAFGWFRGFVGVRRATFESAGCCDDPAIGRRVATGAYPLPSGFDAGYSVLRHGLVAELDSRTPRPDTGSGVRVVLRGEHAARLAGETSREFVRYGAAVSGFLDLTGQNRVISLSVGAAFADPLGDDERAIPFTEQVELGGDQPLRGFLEGRLVDRSALVARLAYDWPVWAFLDGSLQVEAGNVLGARLASFEPDRARLSFALGLRSAGRRDHPFELLVGTATTPLEHGAELDSFRLVIGATDAF